MFSGMSSMEEYAPIQIEKRENENYFKGEENRVSTSKQAFGRELSGLSVSCMFSVYGFYI